MAPRSVGISPTTKYGQAPLEPPSHTGLPGPPTPLESGSRSLFGATHHLQTAGFFEAGLSHPTNSRLGVEVLPAGRFALHSEPKAASGGADAHEAKVVCVCEVSLQGPRIR